ncbi:hypothetical protein VV02_17075 [Luteipulveratus mongoliensis]|uniref:Uncharacterized protein n=1 Tax=Luteipulveratus mongoliensis TaxID=571913 RepID=A0A0K1JR15_9MICO|nr:hypothetical protein VV02_17075 [Luteipulveratus mongoliensis]
MPSRLNLPEPTGIPFTRLVAVELRKLVDTRAGRWLLIGIAAITALVVGIVIFAGNANDSKNFEDFVQATVIPQSLLLPILGIMAVTSEWSQRTGLVTFTLEPHRARSGWSKLVATLLLGLAVVALAFVLAALATGLCQVIRGSDPVWGINVKTIGGILLAQAFGLSQGVAFGMILQNTPAAIVTYFVLPTLWTVLGDSISWLKDAAKWLDTSQALQPLYDANIHGAQWAKLAVAAAVWVLLPLLAGMWRLRRSEVK